MTHNPLKAPRKIILHQEAAAILGVTREHLRLVLLGTRKSPRLLKRYGRLVRHTEQRMDAAAKTQKDVNS